MGLLLVLGAVAGWAWSWSTPYEEPPSTRQYFTGGDDFCIERASFGEEDAAVPPEEPETREAFLASEKRRAQALIWKGLRISPEEWLKAIHSVPGLRLAKDQVERATNPRTGQTISVDCGPYYTEVEVEPGQWVGVFRYNNGRIDLPGLEWNSQNPVAVATSRLALELDARVVNEGGQTLPLARTSRAPVLSINQVCLGMTRQEVVRLCGQDVGEGTVGGFGESGSTIAIG